MRSGDPGICLADHLSCRPKNRLLLFPWSLLPVPSLIRLPILPSAAHTQRRVHSASPQLPSHAPWASDPLTEPSRSVARRSASTTSRQNLSPVALCLAALSCRRSPCPPAPACAP